MILAYVESRARFSPLSFAYRAMCAA